MTTHRALCRIKMIILENETFFILWTRASCGNLSKLSEHIYFHILSAFLIQSWFKEKPFKLKYTQCLFIFHTRTSNYTFSPYYPWGSDDNWNIVTNLRPVARFLKHWPGSGQQRLGSHVRCELRLGWDQPTQRSKHSTWKLDSDPAIEICSRDASQYTATANQPKLRTYKNHWLLFTQNRIHHL